MPPSQGLSKNKSKKTFHSFQEFYPFYLSQHINKVSRYLHLIGFLFAIFWILVGFIQAHFLYFLFAPIFGYGCAWVGHFGFEKNKPATFRYPIYSLRGDFLMVWQLLKEISRKCRRTCIATSEPGN